MLTHGVEFFANGFRYGEAGAEDEVLWSEVTLIKELTIYERPPLLKGPAKLLLPEIASTSYILSTKDPEKAYSFDKSSVSDFKSCERLIREYGEQLSIPWIKEEQHC